MLKVISWVGVGLLSLGVVVAFQALIFGVGGVDFTHPFAIFLALVGLPLMLVGGFITRPRYFWLVSIIAGSLYAIAFAPSIGDLVSKIQHTEREWLFKDGWLLRNAVQDIGPIILGVIGIVEGIINRRIETRRQLQAKQA